VDTEPFELMLRGFGFFDAPDWVVYLDVEASDELRALHRRILEDLHLAPAPFDGAEMHFHATLALELPPEQHARARAELADQPAPHFRFPIERLCLARYADE